MERKDVDAFNQDPRTSFINFLIKNMLIVEEHLYFGGKTLSSIRALIGLIASLDKQSKEKLSEQYKKLFSFSEDATLCTRNELYQIYYDVTNHLHETYLIEFKRRRLEKEDLNKIEEEEEEPT